MDDSEKLKGQIEALIHAWIAIKSGRHTYICHALDEVSWGGSVQEEVHTMLQGCYTYEEWMRESHPRVYDEMKLQLIISKTNPFQQGRLSWIDDMLHKKRLKLATLRATTDV